MTNDLDAKRLPRSSPKPTVVNGLYRGTIAWDEPLRVRKDAGSGARNTLEYKKAKDLRYREKHKEHILEYKRKWRAKKKEAGESYT
jgi:hypothetical protein